MMAYQCDCGGDGQVCWSCYERMREERDEARAAARKYLGPLEQLPRDTLEYVLRVHPWLKESE